MQLVAGATGLCKSGPAQREIGILHGRRLECRPPLLEVGLAVGWCRPDRAPDLVEPREHPWVGRLREPADSERREITARHGGGGDGVEQAERPGRPRRERGDRRLPALRRQTLVGGHERGGGAVAGNSGESFDCLLLNRGIVDEPLEHWRQPVVAGADKRLQGLATLVAVGVAVGEQSPQLRHDPWIAKSHRRQIGQPADRVVGVGAELLVALLPGPRRRHPAVGGQRRHDLLEHPLPHVRVAGRQLRYERLVA